MYILKYFNNERLIEILLKHSKLWNFYSNDTKNLKNWFISLIGQGNPNHSCYCISTENLKKLNKQSITLKYLSSKPSPLSSNKHQITYNHQFPTPVSDKIVTKIIRVINCFSDSKQFELKRYHLWS